jgi:formylglycine-generating enzyme required for sulfatase activity
MKKWMAGLGLMLALLTAPARAWQPNGWVYFNWPYAYEQGTATWYFFSPGEIQSTVPLDTGVWERLNEGALAQGWSWHAGRYAYHSPTRAWYFFGANGRQWCCQLTTGLWSVFGVPPAGHYMVIDLSPGPYAATFAVTYVDRVPPGGWGEEHRTTKLVLRRLPAGTYTMGSPPDELGRDADESQRRVTLTQDFYLGIFPVTQRQWERVLDEWPSWFENVAFRDARPVEQVSWTEARGGVWPGAPAGSGQPAAESFIGALRAKTGLALELPTEAQWEWAARAGTTRALNNGRNLTGIDECPHMTDVGRYWHNHTGGFSGDPFVSTAGGTARVGSYRPNAWGLYDLHGNVWEWCRDWYVQTPPGSVDPVGPATGTDRVLRGGSWNYGANGCRSARRGGATPTGLWSRINGFRLAATPP